MLILMRSTQRVVVNPAKLNRDLILPYELTTDEIGKSIQQVYDILHLIDRALVASDAERLEDFMHAANFSFLLSELVVSGIGRHCAGLMKNRYHNGHPDLVPTGMFAGDSVQYAHEGVEVKCSRYASGWQGHNAEASWVMVAVYTLDTTTQPPTERHPTYFNSLMLAKLEASDWNFAGRNENSRRTPTASILKSGFNKLRAGTVYSDDSPTLA
jgi:hypothetical protein